MDKFIGMHEFANMAFKKMVGTRCPKCGNGVGLAVPMEKSAFLICETCNHQFVKSMDKNIMPRS